MDKINVLRSKGYTYLGHVTTKKNFEALYNAYLQNPYQRIGTAYERYLEKVQVNGVYSYTTLDFETPFSIPNHYDYPALFFHLCHQSIEELVEKYSNSKNIILLFPLELLLQRNYHFKISDKNGLIDYDTYFPYNIELIPSYQEINDYYISINNHYIGNEVVFHDGTYFSNIFKVIGKNINININTSNNYILDYDRLPNYVFYSDRKYDGIKYTFFNLEHRNKHITTDEFYIEFIRIHLPEKYKYLCDNVLNKEELENNIFKTKVNNTDLYTYLYIQRE